MSAMPADDRRDATRHWLDAARRGDESSFVNLYERIAPALFTWAELRIRRDQRAHLEPADLVQEVWFRAWRSLSRFDPTETPFRPWLFRVAKNVLLEASRALQRQERGNSPGSSTRLFALHNAPDTVTAVSRRLARDEGLAAFAAQVDRMEDEERKLVLLCGLEGLPHREVATRMGLGVEAVTKRWQRLRSRLREGGLAERVLTEEEGAA